MNERPKPPADMIAKLRFYAKNRDESLVPIIDKFAEAETITREEGAKIEQAWETAQVANVLDVLKSVGHSVL